MITWIMALRRSRYALNVALVARVALAVAGVILYCEYLHYFIVIGQCAWPALEPRGGDERVRPSGPPLHVMALADTHLLGSRNGHWFDKLRREWQMHRAFQSAVSLHKPDVVVFLGDLFDEGKWCKPQEFAEYLRRFESLFYTPEETEVLVAVGNHDVGFHYSLNPYLVNRFQAGFNVSAVELRQIRGVTFVLINSMALEGDGCFLCRPALNKIKIIGRQLKCAAGDSEACQYWKSSELKQYSQPVILQHYPLFRESDAACHEEDEAPPDVKYLIFRERWECVSKDATDTLLEELSPRLVLSGHTHHGCHVRHNTSDGPVHEYTLPSFSWRNKPNPTFSMVSITSNNFGVYKCHMPHEVTIIAGYSVAGVALVAWLALKKIRRHDLLYVKLPGHLD